MRIHCCDQLEQHMPEIDLISDALRASPKRWLVTGAGGFIGSHLVEALLALGQEVVGLDNFVTGRASNLREVEHLTGESNWSRFRFVEGDIQDSKTCAEVVRGVDLVLHQAALGSVPRSVKDPVASFQSNVMGFLNLAVAAREVGVKRFVYASSSSVYGDSEELPKKEERIGAPLSPYAATKRFNEMIADVFGRCYGFEAIGLRYFNVFGPRQDPEGPYAAVIPKWIHSLRVGERVIVNGDGETSRDFCFVRNVVQANILAATTTRADACNRSYNVAMSSRTTLNELYGMIAAELKQRSALKATDGPIYRDFRVGDVRHSQADLTLIQQMLGYEPQWNVAAGLAVTVDWHLRGSRE